MAASFLPHYGRHIAASGPSALLFLSQNRFACTGAWLPFSPAGGRDDTLLSCRQGAIGQHLNNSIMEDCDQISETGTSYGKQGSCRGPAYRQKGWGQVLNPSLFPIPSCNVSMASLPGHSLIHSTSFSCHLYLQSDAPSQSKPQVVWSLGGASFSRNMSIRGFGASSAWMASGGSNQKDGTVEKNREEIDAINDLFAEARDEIETALESKETTYFNEDAAVAMQAVKQVLDRYNALLEAVGEEQRGVIQRAMGLKMEQLKAELAQLDPEH